MTRGTPASVTSASRRSSILADLGIFPQDLGGATGPAARPAGTAAETAGTAAAAAGAARDAVSDGDGMSHPGALDGNGADGGVGHREAQYARDLVRSFVHTEDFYFYFFVL